VDITAFLRELLFDHDCVIVPGFGGFIGNYTPAQIDHNSDTFYPPVKQISFNRNLNSNDGLLIGKISGSSGIPYGDARNLVENFVVELRKKLDKGEKVVFDNIGTFANNQEGNVLFEPDRDVNYHLDSYGLESFQCMPLEGYDVRKRIIRHTQKVPLHQTSVKKMLWRAAVIIPILSVMVAVPFKTDLFKSKVENSSMNPLVKAEFESNKNDVDNEKGESLKSPDLSSNTPAIEPSLKEIAAPVVSIEQGYYIITGSFKLEQNAVSQVNALKKEGFSPEIIPASNGFYRVSALICNDLNSAKDKKDSISKKYPQTWISRKR
jgi:hypothetical protein